MPNPVWRYSISFGLAGCYLPDSVSGPLVGHTRRSLVDTIKAEIEAYDLPKTSIRQVPVRDLWAHIKRHGSSVAHFSIRHGDNVLSFHGLTEAEAAEAEAED